MSGWNSPASGSERRAIRRITGSLRAVVLAGDVRHCARLRRTQERPFILSRRTKQPGGIEQTKLVTAKGEADAAKYQHDVVFGERYSDTVGEAGRVDTGLVKEEIIERGVRILQVVRPRAIAAAGIDRERATLDFYEDV